ncbi:preprotein translocase subunit SecG [Flaviflagellibacter deserti]|uniref:Protein-export membrane protein SecG n=1 Tax=Flaviflagellibacter deserti TaxID=2267266 RepID=A0ABV9Z1H2_9HYPH
MHTVLIVIHLMIVLALVVTVLLQRSEGGGLGIGGGGGFMTSRGQASALTRATGILAALFFATSIALAIQAGTNRIPQSIIQRNAPGGTGLPQGVPTQGGILDSLKQQQPSAPQAPISGVPQAPAPAAPAAPAPAAPPAPPSPAPAAPAQ